MHGIIAFTILPKTLVKLSGFTRYFHSSPLNECPQDLSRLLFERGLELRSSYFKLTKLAPSISSRKRCWSFTIQMQGEVPSGITPGSCHRSAMRTWMGPGARPSGGEALHLLDSQKVSEELSYQADTCPFTSEKMGVRGSQVHCPGLGSQVSKSTHVVSTTEQGLTEVCLQSRPVAGAGISKHSCRFHRQPIHSSTTNRVFRTQYRNMRGSF